MKGLLILGAFALLALVSCKEDNVEPEPEPGTEYDEAWYAANATISSSDAHFSYTEEGEGAISFKAEGGSVVVYVDCGTEWTAENSAADVFGCELQSTSITVTADQNLVEEELYGTITLMTLPSQIHFATITVTQNAYGAPEITVETNEWNIPAVAATAEELTTEIGVEATGEWSVECNTEWLTAEKDENSVILTATENETFEERTAEVILICTDGYNSDSETITVTQDARAYITLSEEEFEFGKMGGEAEVTVESNYEWGYAYESDWFTVAEGTDGSFTITVDVNTKGDAREGVVTFTAGDGAANVAEATLAITQNAYSVPEITLGETEWHVPAVGEAMTIDITVEASEEWEATTEAYWLTVTKTETGISLTAAQNTETDERIGEVVLSCTDGVTSVSATVTVTQDGAAFITLSNEKFEFSGYGGKATVSIESNFDCEYATSGADWLTVTDNGDNSASISCSDNDTGSARETSVTFTAGDGAANVTETTLTIAQGIKNPDDLVLEYTITSDGTRIQLPVSTSNTQGKRFTIDCTVDWGDGSVVEAFDSEYPTHTYSEQGTYSVTISGTVESLYDVAGGTAGAARLTAVKQWGDTGLKSLSWAFRGCSNLTSLPEGPGPFENVTNFYGAFQECTSLKEAPEDLFKNCTECTNFDDLFMDCPSLAVAPSFEGLSKVTTFQHVFYGCTSLTTVPVNIFSGCTAVTNFTQAFYNCSSVSGESPYDEINVNGETVKVHLYERENYPEYFATPTSTSQCFLNCTNLDDYYSIPNSWGGPELAHPPVSRMSLNSTD